MKYLNEQKKRVEPSHNAKYTINAQYTIYVNYPKKSLKGEFARIVGSESIQIRWFSGLQERRLYLVRGNQRHSKLS
jgi:hypothetical protein